MTALFSRTLAATLCALTLIAAVTVSAGQAGKSGDLLTSTQVKDLVATAKTPADHMRLSKHFSAVAAKYDSDAAEHLELGAAYRKSAGGGESKRPGAPDTAIHCDRLAALDRDAAKEARSMATSHEHMAAAK